MKFSHRGVDIDVNSKGFFVAQPGQDAEVSGKTLEECKEAIDAYINSTAKATKLELAVVGILQEDESGMTWREKQERVNKPSIIRRATLIGLNRTTGDLMFSGLKKRESLARVLPAVPEATVFLQHYLDIQSQWNRIRNRMDSLQISHKAGRTEAEDYPKLIQERLEQWRKTCYELGSDPSKAGK